MDNIGKVPLGSNNGAASISEERGPSVSFGAFAVFFSGEKDLGNIFVQFIENSFVGWGAFVG